MKYEDIITELEERKKSVGEERDRLRELEYEISDLKEVCDRAWDALQEAIYSLSELV